MEQTELGAVNAMLEVIEETALQTIDRTHPDVLLALNTWDEQSVAVQSEGWWFNKEQYQLVVDARTNEVFLPSGVLAVDLTGTTYIKRGRRLYDKENHTYIFETDTPAEDLLVDCIMEWSVDELPPSIYRLILLQCKIVMVSNRDQDQVKLQLLDSERALASVTAKKENLAYMDTSAMQSNSFLTFQATQPRRRMY